MSSSPQDRRHDRAPAAELVQMTDGHQRPGRGRRHYRLAGAICHGITR
jgi:hypothetical protein